MAMQVKHMVTFGLGLGIATAFGYHFLSSPQNNAAPQSVKHLTPLNNFEIVKPPSLTSPTLVPTQPQLDNHFRAEVPPVQTSIAAAMPPTGAMSLAEPTTFGTPQSGYQKLVARMQPALPVAANRVEPVQQVIQADDSDSSFSLDLGSPSDSEAEFVLDSAPQVDAQPTENMMELGSTVAGTNSGFELTTDQLDQAADEILADDEIFAANSAQAVPTQNQDESFTVVVDYNSNPLSGVVNTPVQSPQATQKGPWKANPFIKNTGTEVVGSAPVSISEMSSTSTAQQGGYQINSVLSLNDVAHEQRSFAPAIASEAVQSVHVDPAIAPETIQSVQVAPQVQLTLSNSDAQKAVHHIEYGKALSRRGAAFTARQEFLAAMQVIAAANDKASGDNRHTKALRIAMLTIREANDFSVANSEQQIYMNVASVVETHRSQALTAAQAESLSPVQAMNRYFAQAQEQLDLAGGRNPVSAEVFYCMGKLHTLLNRNEKVLGPYETAQSVVYHQAALLSENQHHRSANELGVLLARSGRLEQSKMLFERSLMSQPTIRTWQNLAETHRRLGETGFANQAAAEVHVLASQEAPVVDSNIQWKPIDVFNADAPVEFHQQRVAQLPQLPVLNQQVAPSKPSPVRAIADKIKGMF